MNISDFFNSMYVDASSYDNLRSIASEIDGLKNSGRKVLHTVIEKNINSDVKVSRLKSTVADFTEYLHGEDNLSNVIVNIARRYVGTNNLPLLKDQGNYGKRFITTAAADRYISTCSEDYLEYLFPKEDRNILKKQIFEGREIEPRYLVPILPMLLVNGSMNAISTGFAQNILPRKVKDIIKSLENYFETGIVKVPKPGWEGYSGKIMKNKEKSWVVYGKIEKINSTSIKVTEIPIGIDLAQARAMFKKLKEDKIITSFKEKSKDDKFIFELRVSRKLTNQSNEEILNQLNLKDVGRRFSENYTTIGEDNRIQVHEGPEAIFMNYISVRERAYKERKEFLILDSKRKLRIINSKLFFIESVISKKILVNNKLKKEIESQMENFNEIQKEDSNYDYLLRLPIYSLTKEKLESLKLDRKNMEDYLKDISKKSEKDFWKEDLNKLKKSLKIK